MKIYEVGAGFTSILWMKKPRLHEGCLATEQSEARNSYQISSPIEGHLESQAK